MKEKEKVEIDIFRLSYLFFTYGVSKCVFFSSNFHQFVVTVY